jgi:hypothetical protein
MNRFLTRTTRWIAIGLVSAALAGCGGKREGPEAEIRAWLDEMQAAAEDERRGDIVDRIAEGYTDTRGNSRDQIDNTLRALFFRSDGITLFVDVEEIEVFAETAAEVRLTVAMAGTGAGAFGISADAYRFELELGYTGSDWELLSARWGELGESLK